MALWRKVGSGSHAIVTANRRGAGRVSMSAYRTLTPVSTWYSMSTVGVVRISASSSVMSGCSTAFRVLGVSGE